MPSSLAKRVPTTERNTVATRLPLIGAVPQPAATGLQSHATDDAIDSNSELEPIKAALAQAGLSQKFFAHQAKADEPQVSRVLTGQAKSGLWGWLWKQDVRFWVPFLQILAVAKGITHECEADVDAERIGELVTLLLKTRRA